MRKAALPRRSAALVAAAALHALLAVLVVSRVVPQAADPPAIQVTLVDLPPRSHPMARPPARARAATRRPASAVSVPARAEAPPKPGRDPTPTTDWRVRASEPEAEGARATLRARLGCRTADLLALTEAERAACQDALAKGAENAPTYAVVSPKLRKVFDGTFECPKDDVWCEYRIGKAPYPGLLAPRKKKDPSWD